MRQQIDDYKEQITELNRNNADAAGLSDASGESISMATHRRQLERLENSYLEDKKTFLEVASKTIEGSQIEYDMFYKLYTDQRRHAHGRERVVEGS